MSFEVCGMIVERVNLAVLIHVWEDATLLPLHANMGLLLLLATNYGHSGDAPRSHGPVAQTCSFSRQIVEFLLSFRGRELVSCYPG